MMPLILSEALKRRIEAEGSAAYPHECCGVMVGRDGAAGRVVERLEAMDNVWDTAEQRRRFAIDPKALMRIDREVAAEGKVVLGFYHSHPDHPARPSETDRMYGWPFYSYVIVSIQNRQPAEMTCWMLNEETEQFEEQSLAVGRGPLTDDH
jgi:proteasome lid subunit RPN8/RPN11